MNGGEVQKLDAQGNKQWSYTGLSGRIFTVAVDDEGYVYIGSRAEEAHKVDPQGNNVWTYTGAGRVNGVAVDEEGKVYVGSGNVHKLDASGSKLWEKDLFSPVFCVAVDDQGNVYAGTKTRGFNKLNSSGDKQWSYGKWANGAAVGKKGNVYLALENGEVHKVDSSGNMQWKYTGHSEEVKDVAVDEDGYVYSASNDAEVHKLDPSGNRVWAYTQHVGSNQGVLGVGADPGAFPVSQAPVMAAATTGDTDGNGQIDEITLQFSETVDVTDGNSSDALPGFSVDGYTIADADYGATGTNSLTLTLVESGSEDTGTTPTISYDRSTSNSPTVDDQANVEHLGESRTPTDGVAPVVAGGSLGNDGSDSLTFDFDTGEQLGDSASDVAVTVDGPNTTGLYSFDRSDFSESGSYTYTLQPSKAYSDGAGTYTVSVNDAIDPSGNDGADGSQTDTYQFNADVALVDGRDGEAYDPPAPTPGTNDNPVGRFKLSADVSGSSLSNVTITQDGSTPSGVDAIELWRSSDNSFETSNDTEIASQSYSDNATFSSVGTSIPTGDRYVFVVVDLASDAGGDYDPKIASEGDIGYADGVLASVNGTSTTSFTDAYLLSSSTALPVELAGFSAVTSEEGVVLKWRTASEQNNTGFRVQRRVGERGGAGAWERVGFVEGAGTTDQPQSYRFTDAEPPYEADQLEYRLQQVDTDGTAHPSETVTINRSVKQVRLKKPFPNPAAGQVTVRYALPEAQEVSLRLYDVLGREVRTVVRSEQAGRHERQLDVRGLPSGTYFLRLRASGVTRTRRLTVLR